MSFGFRVKGIQCCTGYVFNEKIGDCEKCPTGYFGDCSKRCTPPTYGEDCQSLCHCTQGFYCHFAYGCLPHINNETDHQQTSSLSLVSTEHQTATSRYPISNVTVLHQGYSKQYSEIVTNGGDTTVKDRDRDIDVFKDNKVFLVIVILIGIFVLCFAIFVFTYTYFKCFRKTSKSRVKENELQAHYKSLDFEAMILEQPRHQAIETRGRFISESSYLSPVFIQNENYIEPRVVPETEIMRENNEALTESELTRQSTANRVNEAILPTGNLTEHVYIEITEDDCESESQISRADDGRENREVINLIRSATLRRESAYLNESK
uniref:Uncharacterized protein LOC111104529 isoform X3 n=1 Tax=Crassostrea virginica TaxID=6565 RepID=A0A8B8AU91_CRAVI|nr:uncharacterized protein LOC111104529 isoform X3 [Crassostrea virginica]